MISTYGTVQNIYPRTDVFMNYIEEEFNKFDSSVIMFNETLNPNIFNIENYIMKDNIRKILLNIVNYFLKEIEKKIIIDEITITGSIVNYNYNKFSDIDLHFIIDKSNYYEKDYETFLDYLKTKAKLWNYEHNNIKLFKHNIEIYFQEKTEIHSSNGVYNLISNSWIKKPSKKDIELDYNYIKNKFNNIVDKINYVISKDDLSMIETLIDNIKLYRKSGINMEGEYSYENIIYKCLKYFGYMDKLYNFKRKFNIENK